MNSRTDRSAALCAALLLALGAGCDDPVAETPVEPDVPVTAGERAAAALPPTATAEERLAAQLDADFPRHGAIVAPLETVHAGPSREAPIVGWLRVGGTIRVGAEERRGDGCDGRWTPVHPRGWVCDDAGIEVRDAPIPLEEPTLEGWHDGVQAAAAAPRGALILPATSRDEPLPYDYYYVRESTVPEYHRLPSRNEQRAAIAKAERYRELLGIDERRAARYLRGESEDGPPGTAVVARYLDRGFFVASNGVEVRASRRFVRSTGGRYLKQAQLEPRSGHDLGGVVLASADDLPLAWTVRTARPMIQRETEAGEASFVFDEEAEPIERQTRLTGWQERRNVGGRVMHVLETEAGPRYLRAWFASVAERIDRPSEIGADEPWVHVDLSEQTLVLYEGDRPVYATLVSTGVDEHATPTGVFTIRRKHVTDTMSNLGPEAGDDRYSIEDVPWTQYFDAGIALHTAFWHTRFGLPRSHGCVNMSPADAHYVFQRTWPAIPEGWHGVQTEGEPRASHVVVTD